MKATIFNLKILFSITDERFLYFIFNNMLKESGFNIVNYCKKQFAKYGYTGLWLLCESHLAIHTFPEENSTYIELSSCVEEYYNNFKKKIFNEYKENIIKYEETLMK